MSPRLEAEIPAPTLEPEGRQTVPRYQSLWEPLVVEDANDFLREGAYGLRVERSDRGTIRLAGPGTGSGLSLGTRATWADLFGMLVLLRRTRRRHDSAWLHRLTGALTAESGEAASTERFALPRSRVEVLTAGDSRAAQHCLDTVSTSDGSILFPGQAWTDSPLDGAGVAVGGPERIVELRAGDAGGRFDRERVRYRLRAWEQLSTAVAQDPVLRMHCATQPVPAALVDRSTGSAVLARTPEPAPRHPEHPGGTIIAGLPTLLRPVTGDIPRLLCQVIDNRVERREAELHYFLEHFVRPPLRAFRLALDAHGIGLFSIDERSVGFELSPELRATGRIVITDYSEVHDRPGTASVPGGAAALTGTIDALATGFIRIGVERPETVRAAVDRIVAEELRYLEPETADLLSCAHPLRHFVHAVPETQDDVLKKVLQRVQERTRRRRWARALPQPAVIVDLDACAITPELTGPGAVEFCAGGGLPAGLVRFVWDVRDAGGRVLFWTSRADQDPPVVENVLAGAGIADPAVVCQPDDSAPLAGEQRVRRHPECAGLDVVAVFGDRAPIARDFPGAHVVAVSGSRRSESGSPEPEPAVTTFETKPGRGSGRVAKLSNAHSLEELQVGALRRNRQAQGWAVRLTEDESLSIVDSVLCDAKRSAERAARNAIVKFGLQQDLPREEREHRVARALHHVFSRKQFLKGSRSNYRPEHMWHDAGPFVRRETPIEVVLLGFPVKQCLNRLKASGPLPDLAELGALARLRELQQAVSAVHPPGLHFNILTDGRHFRRRPAAITQAYTRKLREYATLVGIEHCATIEEVDALATRRFGPQLPAERAVRVARYQKELAAALSRFDITDNPLGTLDAVDHYLSEVDNVFPCAPALFRELLMSLVYSVPMAFPGGTERLAWSAAVYADVYNVNDRAAPSEVLRARRAVLRRTWEIVIRYLATLQVDQDLGYEDLLPRKIRLTVSAATSGRCGFTYLGGSGLLPWQGTGVVDARGQVAVDFMVSMLDQGFVPVYSPLVGPRQPWMMVPAHVTHLDDDPFGVPHPRGNAGPGNPRLDADFAARIRLRRK